MIYVVYLLLLHSKCRGGEFFTCVRTRTTILRYLYSKGIFSTFARCCLRARVFFFSSLSIHESPSRTKEKKTVKMEGPSSVAYVYGAGCDEVNGLYKTNEYGIFVNMDRKNMTMSRVTLKYVSLLFFSLERSLQFPSLCVYFLQLARFPCGETSHMFSPTLFGATSSSLV